MSKSSKSILAAGVIAPEFELPAEPKGNIRLGEFRGKPVVLAFYPADFSPVCGDQMALYNEILPEFDAHGAQLLGISVDGVWCHSAYAKERKLRFPLLSDFQPRGKVAGMYGAYREADGICERAIFVIDGAGVIRWSFLSPIGTNPEAEGILRALETISKEGGR